MNRRILGLLALGLMAVPLAATAQIETLNYQSTQINGYSQYDNAFGLVTYSPVSSAGIVGTVVLGGPLIANGTEAVVPISWSFTSPIGFPLDSSFFDSEKGGAVESVLFSFTTSNRTITNWNIDLSFGPIEGSNTTAVTTFASSGNYANGQDLFSSNLYSPEGSVIQQASSAGPGTWNAIVQAPEIDPAAAASGLTLLLGGTTIMRGRRKLGEQTR
jgi:hypothetical protein